MPVIQLDIPKDQARAAISSYYVSTLPAEYGAVRLSASVSKHLELTRHLLDFDRNADCDFSDDSDVFRSDPNRKSIVGCRRKLSELETGVTVKTRATHLFRLVRRVWCDFQASVQIVKERSMACH